MSQHVPTFESKWSMVTSKLADMSGHVAFTKLLFGADLCIASGNAATGSKVLATCKPKAAIRKDWTGFCGFKGPTCGDIMLPCHKLTSETWTHQPRVRVNPSAFVEQTNRSPAGKNQRLRQ